MDDLGGKKTLFLETSMWVSKIKVGILVALLLPYPLSVALGGKKSLKKGCRELAVPKSNIHCNSKTVKGIQ